jgi:hypothetical protein
MMYARRAADGVLSRALKPGEANAVLGGGRLMVQGVKQSLANRAQRNRLVAQEAEVIETSAA